MVTLMDSSPHSLIPVPLYVLFFLMLEHEKLYYQLMSCGKMISLPSLLLNASLRPCSYIIVEGRKEGTEGATGRKGDPWICLYLQGASGGNFSQYYLTSIYIRLLSWYGDSDWGAGISIDGWPLASRIPP